MYKSESFAQSLHIPVPDNGLSRIYGMESVKAELSEIVQLRREGNIPSLLGLRLPKLLIMNGDGDSNKLFYAEVLAGELGGSGFDCIRLDPHAFISLPSAELEKKLTTALNEVIISSPCTVICEEAELLCPKRTRGLCSGEERARASIFISLISELCACGADFVFVAMTNDSNAIDETLLNLADRVLTIPLPDKQARAAFFRQQTSNLKIGENLIEYLSENSRGDYSELRRISERMKLELWKNLKSSYGIFRPDGSLDGEKTEKQIIEAINRGEAVLTIDIAKRAGV